MQRVQKFTLSSRRAPRATASATTADLSTTSVADNTDPIATAMDQAEAERPHLLTPQQVADMLGLTERTLERWRITGEGPRYSKLSRSTVRYLREDIKAFVADRLRVNTAQ